MRDRSRALRRRFGGGASPEPGAWGRSPQREGLLEGDVIVDADDATAIDDVDVDGRGVGVGERAALAVVDAVVLALEGQKLRHGFAPEAVTLREHFASPDEAREILRVVADIADRLQLLPPKASAWRPQLPSGAKAVHVVVGGGARRVFDLLVPSLRRLRVELSLVGAAGPGPQRR